MILDMNGVELKKGQIVRVHQEEEVSTAWIVDTFADRPIKTKHQPGYWIDINKGDGIEGMMSYILEVISNIDYDCLFIENILDQPFKLYTEQSDNIKP